MSKNLDSPWYRPSQGPDWLEFKEDEFVSDVSAPPEPRSIPAESPWYVARALPAKWSETKKLKHSLLRRAFEENRGGEVILLIQWRLAQEAHLSKGASVEIREFEMENKDQPQSIRALNLLEKWKCRHEKRGKKAVSYRYVETPSEPRPEPLNIN